jgi:hypothetical protein
MPSRITFTTKRFGKAGERGGGGQNTRDPDCTEGPGNLGKMFVSFMIVVIDRKTYQM